MNFSVYLWLFIQLLAFVLAKDEKAINDRYVEKINQPFVEKEINKIALLGRNGNKKAEKFIKTVSNSFDYLQKAADDLYMPDNYIQLLQNKSQGHRINKKNMIKLVELSDGLVRILTQPQATKRDPTPRNVTCNRTEEYKCKVTVNIPYNSFCRYLFYTTPCVKYRQEFREICTKTIVECCQGYTLGANGYCERAESGCGGPRVLTSNNGIITTPKYPNLYAAKLQCKWSIRAPRGYKVILKFMDIDLEEPIGACDLSAGTCFNLCQFDSVHITDKSKGQTRRLCGELLPADEYVNNGDTEIEFESDSSFSGRGFKLAYSIVRDGDIEPRTCPNGKVFKLCPRRCALVCEMIMPDISKQWNICIKNDNTRSGEVEHSAIMDITCQPGCDCPPDRPVWLYNTCVKIENCTRSKFNCGIPIPKPTPKIVGGRRSTDGAYPWMVQITTNDLHSDCGGTLICSDWLITAAHCFLDKATWSMPKTIKLDMYWFHLGKYWKFEQEDNRIVQSFRAARIIIHPEYDFVHDLNDIALIQITDSIRNFDHVRPACLPTPLNPLVNSEFLMNLTQGFPGVGDTCIVTGWGVTRDRGPSSHSLKELNMPVKPEAQCDYSGFVWRKIICAGGVLNEDSCKGDSGGPFLCTRDGRWYLDGITSFGHDCGIGKPGGYTRVTNYVPWIRFYVGSECGRPS